MQQSEMVSRTINDKVGHTMFEVTFTTGKGEVVRKVLNPEEYASLIGASLKEVRQKSWRLKPEMIPEGFLDGVIADPKNYHIAFKVKGQVRHFVHTSGSYLIPFPDLVFVVRVSKGIVGGSVYALKDGDDTLYQYPFGNVSTAGKICFGNIDPSAVVKRGPAVMTELFFTGKTNNDYIHEGSHIRSKLTQEELLQQLNGKKKFPKRLLKPTGGTLTCLLKDIVGAGA